MDTINKLYNNGQRRFVFECGGLSPALKRARINKHKTIYYASYDEDNIVVWSEDGEYEGSSSGAFDLVPKPLPTLESKISTLEKNIEYIGREWEKSIVDMESLVEIQYDNEPEFSAVLNCANLSRRCLKNTANNVYKDTTNV